MRVFKYNIYIYITYITFLLSSDEGFKSPHSDTQLSGAPCASDHVEVHHHDARHNDRHNTLRSGEWLRASIRPVTMTIPWGLRVPPMHSITLTKSPKHPLNSLNTKADHALLLNLIKRSGAMVCIIHIYIYSNVTSFCLIVAHVLL